MSFGLLVPSNIAGQLYVRALTNAYRRGTAVYDPDYAHIQDPEAYDKIRRDPVIAHAMQFRRHMIAGKDWSLVPSTGQREDAHAAKILEQAIKECKRFSSARFNLTDAVFRGSAFAKIIGKRVTRTWGDGKPRKWWVPTRLKDIDRWRFRQVPIHGDPQLRTRWEFWRMEDGDGRWVPLTASMRRQMVVHTYYDTEPTLGYGRGLLEALYHFYWAKTHALQEGLQGLERWSQGWITMELESLRSAGINRTNDAMVTQALDMLENFRSRHVAVHGSEDKISVHETSGKGHEIVMSIVQYLDDAMVRLILAGLMPTGSTSATGSFARAKQEAESTEALIQYDRELLSEDISCDLLSLIWRLNRANLHDLGLGKACMPRFQIHHSKQSDPVKAIDVATKAIQGGIPLKREEVYAKIGYSIPSEDDETITLQDAQRLLNSMGSDRPSQRDPVTGRFFKQPETENSSTDQPSNTPDPKEDDYIPDTPPSGGF